MHRPTRTLAALAVTATLTAGALGALAGPAAAQTGGDGTRAQATLLQKIDERLGQLGRLHAEVDASKTVTADHKAALDATLDDHTAGLTQLRADVAATTDLQQLATDARSMVEDHRVYLVLTPEVHLVLGHDLGARAVDVATTKVQPKLAAAIDKAQAAGKDTAQATADDQAFTSAVAAAGAALEGIDSTALALQPQGYPGNRPTIEGARDQLKEARTQIQAARAAAKKVVEDLKALR